MDAPFAIRVEDRAPLTVMAVTRGSTVVTADTGELTTIAPGDVALLRGPDPYQIADAPDRPPTVLVLPGGACTTPEGVTEKTAEVLGVRTWGSNPDGDVAMLIGTYEHAGEVSRRLLDALPPVAVVRSAEWDSPLVDLLGAEIDRDRPGQDAVLDRLLDLVLVSALRTWFARPDSDTPAWYQAHDDPVVGHALRLLQERPAEPWTVAALAHEVGVSRATLARRFSEEVGETPMAFLTERRLSLAADLLREPGTTVAGVARQVGYGSGFALSAAFSRVRGVTPSEHRASVAADA
jgi:AraC-like DNA-binding protein